MTALWMVLGFVVAIGPLIFFHEFGHFLMAKWAGVGVLKFSLGFGPRVVGFCRGETEYLLSAIPLGGYVKMVGEDPKEEGADPAKSFSAKPVGWRTLIVLAGPGANFFLAILIFWAVFIFGVPILGTKIGEVREGFPAAEKGLRPGDRIVALDGRPLRKWEELATRIHRSPGREVRLVIERNGQRFEVRMTPRLTREKNIFGEEVEIGLLGIGPAEEFLTERKDPATALGLAVVRSVDLSWLILKSLVKMVEGKVSTRSIGGPLLVAQMAGQQAREGLLNLVSLIAALSITLAVFNLLPIPILDGGHLLFSALEVLKGSPVSLRKREIAQQVGLALLIALMVFAFYNDIFRLLSRP